MQPPDDTRDSDEADEAPTLLDTKLRDELTQALSLEELDEVPAPRSTTVTTGAPADPHTWFLGRSFGGFRIVTALASGGMATVFLGRKEGPRRVSKYAAIKVVHPHLAFERDFVNMFLDEARIAALVDHPNVCSVLDFGVAEGTYYLAMEYLLGETWSAVRSALAEHPDGLRSLPVLTAYVLSQACEGLHAAHEAVDEHGRPLHIVHRDVSPQNIFVAYDGTVRVLDFGIARAADRITSTRDGTLKGRLAYMCPEQMAGAEVGRAADIWSMGVVLREALEGKRLFRRATDAETMLAVTHEPIPEWSADVHPSLRAIVERALSRDPNERFATAHEMAVELSRFTLSAATVGSSELSAWMGFLFAAQIEQKRALLQLPMPTPVEDAAHPWPRLPQESSSEISVETRGPVTVPARAPARAVTTQRPRWINASALLALASIGAIAGLLLGRLVRRTPTPVRVGEPAAEVSVQPVPTVETVGSGGPKPDAPPGKGRRDLTRTPEPTTKAGSGASGGDEGSEGAERSDRGERRRRRAEETEGTATAAGTGAVLVAFEGGWAEVYLGPQLLGTTPGRFNLPAGKQTLTVRPFGTGKPFTKRVEVSAGETVKLFLASPSL